MYDYTILPEHMRGAAKRYIEHGIEPGDFLSSVICNDLMGAIGRADHINRERLHDICSFFYNEAPSPCWGSPEKMAEWMRERRKAHDTVDRADIGHEE